MIAPQHFYRHSTNPRANGRCDCGQPEAAHPKPVPQVLRLPDLEREITAASSVGLVDSSSLSDFADRRAHDGPLRDFDTRDWDLEVAEELSDARNYICWAIQRDHAAEDDGGTDRRRALRSQALGYVAAAFVLIEQARSR